MLAKMNRLLLSGGSQKEPCLMALKGNPKQKQLRRLSILRHPKHFVLARTKFLAACRPRAHVALYCRFCTPFTMRTPAFARKTLRSVNFRECPEEHNSHVPGTANAKEEGALPPLPHKNRPHRVFERGNIS